MNALRNIKLFLSAKTLQGTQSSFKNYRKYSVAAPDRLVSIVENEELRIATVFMQRPAVNSLNLELLEQLTGAIKDLESRKFKGFVLASKSPTVFSAGLDIMEMYQPKEDRFRKFWSSLQEMWKTLYSTPLFTMAAINGHSPAGGCMMALSCDYRIMMDKNALIGMNETLLGLSAPNWFSDLLIDNIGFRRAEKSLYMGSLHTPQEALALNIVDELVSSQEELETKIQKHMALWLQIPATGRRMTKLGLRRPLIQKLESYQEQELEGVFHYVQSEGVQKTLGKYLESLKKFKATS